MLGILGLGAIFVQLNEIMNFASLITLLITKLVDRVFNFIYKFALEVENKNKTTK